MHMLEKEHPGVFDFFTHKHHIIRRSDRYCVRLSTDPVIEQSLMRSVKTKSGHTLMASCKSIEVKYCTSDKHKESSRARKEIDNKDTRTFSSFIQEGNPFIDDILLRNIESGVLTDTSVNVDIEK